jgi:N-acyl-D-amino-acid deacylase
MAEYTLVVRNGTVVDGSGLAAYRADVGVIGDRIATVGRIRERGDQEIDAEGHVVTPGFVDGHTHMDAQVFWDPLGTSSCFHGVTSVVMGNCGFTLAPSKPDARALVVQNLERAEDIPAESLAIGIDWSWEHFAGYLDALERLPKGINYAAYVGHSALRSWAMGERAFTEEADADDLALMRAELEDALAAGAVGFTTSRSGNHLMTDGRPVASRVASWDEVVALVSATADAGGGVFELANESAMSSPDPEVRAESMGRLLELAVTTGVPTTFGVTTFGDVNRWTELLALLDRAAAAGGRMLGQSSSREQGVMYSFRTWLPFDDMAVWREVRARPLAEQEAALRDPDTRRRLVEAARDGTFSLGGGPQRRPDYDRIQVVHQAVVPNPSLAAVAAERGVEPVEVVIDLALETGFDQFFLFVTGNADAEHVRTILEHPHTVMTFSDSGAHVSQIINSSLHTHLLSYWVRERQAFTLEEAVRMITLAPATAWGFADRGLVREGFVADLNVFDPVRVAPDLPTVTADLPGGATRLRQTATGFLATIVGGEVVLRDREPTGVLPGRVLRRRRP